MDDEKLIRHALQKALEQIGYDVVLAADGREAVELYEQAMQAGRPFDLAILDLTVRAGMGGVEAMSMLRNLDPAVRALVMSGYANNEVLQEYARYGFKEALAKPFEMGTLRAAVSRVQGSSR